MKRAKGLARRQPAKARSERRAAAGIPTAMPAFAAAGAASAAPDAAILRRRRADAAPALAPTAPRAEPELAPAPTAVDAAPTAVDAAPPPSAATAPSLAPRAATAPAERPAPPRPAKGVWVRLTGRLGELRASESGAAPNWLASLMRRAGFGGDEAVEANVYRDANRDWSERRGGDPQGPARQAPGYTWQKPGADTAPPRQQTDRRQAPQAMGRPIGTIGGGVAAAAAPGRRAAHAGATVAARGGGGEWVLPSGAPGGEDRPDPRSAFGGSLPKPLAALTDRLSKMVEGNENFSQRFIDTLDRIAHNTTGKQRPAPSAKPPGGGWRASMADAAGGRRDAGDRSFFGTGSAASGEWSDAELIQDAKEASKRETSHLARTLLRFVLLFIAVFLVWAALFQIDEVTRGDGRVVASSQTQILGNLEGGVVREVLVREGDRVAKGDVMMRLDNVQAVSQYRENRAKYLTLTAQLARLRSEIGGTPLSFPPEVMAEMPDVARAEAALLAARVSQFEAQMQILRQQRMQRAQDLADLRNKADKSGQQLKLVREQLRILEPLAAEGLAPRVEVIRNQRDLAQTAGELESAQLQIPKAESAMREADRKIDERMDGFKSDAQKELNDKALQLEQARETEVSTRDRVTRTELRAPLNGVVKQINVKTIGGTVKPGQDLVEVVPSEDTLLVEIRIRPADVGFVRVGQKANVKVSAYDYSLFGALDAKVEDISADTFTEERAGPASEPYFRVRLRTAKSFLGTADRPLPISPGMVVNADILTGERTVLTYLTKPFFKTIGGSLGER
jgi:adhesin transport system membrane fusion protein